MDLLAAHWWKILEGAFMLFALRELTRVREDAQLLRLQMNRLTGQPPSSEDRERLETDDALDTLTAHDLKLIEQRHGADFIRNNPDVMLEVEERMKLRQPPLKNA